MNKEKLYNAARSEAFDLVDCAHKTDSHDIVEAFVQGAEWLMGQPLSERLSDGERKNIRKLNSIIESMFDMLPEGHVNQRRVIQVEDMLIKIFGKGMFENLK